MSYKFADILYCVGLTALLKGVSVDEFARLGGILPGEAACSRKSELRWSSDEIKAGLGKRLQLGTC